MAKKKKSYFLCNGCGSDFNKWQGQCPDCGEWNSIVEVDEPTHSATKSNNKIESVPLSSIVSTELKRIETGIGEFNLVCGGGGIVPGSVILIGGEPGIGKSTLVLQIANYINCLYISGEESPLQLRHRAERLKVDPAKINVSTSTVVEDIILLAEKENPDCLIIDSIQTIYSRNLPGIAGSVSQIRDSTTKLVEMAKKSGTAILLVGHITKEGSIAGPKVLEHLVDTVLYFEGDFSRDFRMLRAFKNRFGSVNEIGLFRMSANGLEEVKDKNNIFLNPFTTSAPGNAVSAAIEGSRTILFEVQSLVSFTNFSNPRRMSDGLDYNRLVLIAAVLEKHGGLKLNSYDIFVKVSGGFRIDETAGDLAVAMAVASSLKEVAIPKDTAFLGELSLSGELRPVSQCARRIQEMKLAGYKTVVLSEHDAKDAKKTGFEGEIIGVRTIDEVLGKVF